GCRAIRAMTWSPAWASSSSTWPTRIARRSASWSCEGSMAETVEEVSYNYEDEGKLVRKEVKKEILTKGAWATVMFLYRELDRKTESWGPPKVSIVRFKKSGGVYR